jgi:hypothetical protein
MAKSKATKGDSKGEPIVTEEDVKQNKSSGLHAFKNLDPTSFPEVDDQIIYEAICSDVLHGLYVNHLNWYMKNKDVKSADELLTKEQCETHEKQLNILESAICYVDQTDEWLNDLHEGKFNEKPKDK